jgi:hypothetical protein
MQNRWFDYGGDAVIRTDKYVRLTGDIGSRAGWVFSRVPLTATNWEIEVEFKISGTGTLYGDGMAMWLTKQRAQGGNVFGFQDKFDGLGVFIDTYKNNRPGIVFPYVMAMLGDGQTVYDKENDGKANELAGCSVRISLFLPVSKMREKGSELTWKYSGTRHTQRPTAHQASPDLLPGQVPHPRPAVQIRRKVGELLHPRRRQDTLRRVPGLQRRDGRARR